MALIISSLLLSTGLADLTGILELTQKTLYQGESATLTVALRNTGFQREDDISLTINMVQALGGAKTVKIPQLHPGGTYTRDIFIQTLSDTPLGEYEITGTVQQKGFAQPIPIATGTLNVKAYPIITSHVLQKEAFAQAEESKLTIRTENKGQDVLKDVRIKLIYPPNFIAPTTEQLIGDLAPEEEISKTFSFTTPKKGAAYHVSVETTFSDQDGAHVPRLYTLSLNVAGEQQFGFIETILTIIILLLIIRLFWAKFA
ncbi:MAG: hypothetical protein J4432_03300 [DPANN group archaeon]|nr:hypothetical protein [DPANN group archaeon]